MKIAICNIPLRSDEEKSTYPPLGALAVIQSLRRAGYDTDFYDVNFFRPSGEEIKNYFLKNNFDIVGISATVATSYKSTKELVSIIKSVLPKIIIVVGGALTASSDVVLNFNDVDFCVVGEGEKVIVNLVNYIKFYGTHKLKEELKKIKGLCFLDKTGEVIFTGHEQELSVDEINDPDYSIIEKYSDINQYIVNPFIYEQFKYDEGSFEKSRRGKKLATVVSSRGCINQCTFCYRWQKGIRIFPVDRVIRNVRYLTENYNVGFISFGDEDFGATKKWLEEFTEKIKTLDVVYRIGAICAENINPELLKKLKESGCVAVHYGLESGSDKMLRVMEKRANAELNEKAVRWTHQAGLQTVPALLVGMPGESYETIRETTDFLCRITEFSPRCPPIGTNLLVTLPGTPVYEYARFRGFLGKTLADEEEYLLGISDQVSHSLRHLNLTDYPHFIVQGWAKSMVWSMLYNYYRKSDLSKKISSRWLYSNTLFYRLHNLIAPLYAMYGAFRRDKKLFVKKFFELLIWPLRKKHFKTHVPLRKFLCNKGAYL